MVAGSGRTSSETTAIPSRNPYSQERASEYKSAVATSTSPVFKKNASAPRRGISAAPTSPAAARLKDNSTMSFVMLTESQVKPPPLVLPSPSSARKSELSSQSPSGPLQVDSQAALSHKIEANNRLFEILSSRSDIDHPICNECTDLLLAQFHSRLQASTKERDAYIAFLKELRNNVPTEAEVDKAQANLQAAKQAEKEAFATLVALEKEKAQLEEEIIDLEAESRELDREEEAFWRSRNAFDVKVAALASEKDALNASYDHDADQLERLQRTNVYNDTFCISHDGNFGTINGLRLGRLPAPNNVDWPEINAAWGATALLLVTVAEKLAFNFRGYAIKPMGSTSRIERFDFPSNVSAANSVTSTATSPMISNQAQARAATLDLFSSGDLPLGKTLLHRRFNEAMIAFLECLNQLGEHVERSGARNRQGEVLRLPYTIEKDKIHGISIKLGASQDEAWTGACKYTLTCCKFLLAHASNIASGSKS